jgi:hypothetical protein
MSAGWVVKGVVAYLKQLGERSLQALIIFTRTLDCRVWLQAEYSSRQAEECHRSSTICGDRSQKAICLHQKGLLAHGGNAWQTLLCSRISSIGVQPGGYLGWDIALHTANLSAALI